MPEAFDDLQQAIDAAEQAAAAGNLATAEVHLYEVLRLQKQYVGEADPDVAATFHKLAIVFERTGRIAEAEAMYRRAVAVASAVLPADDPLLRQCSDDLTAFLATASSAKAAVVAPAAAPRPAPVSASPVGRPPDRAPAPAAIRRDGGRARQGRDRDIRRGCSPRLASWRRWSSSRWSGDRRTRRRRQTRPAPQRRPPRRPRRHRRRAAKPATPAPAARQPEPSAPPPAHGPDGAARRQDTDPRPPRLRRHRLCHRPRPLRRGPLRRRPPQRGVQVLDARLCRQLTPSGEWTCLPPENPPAFGRYYYLTRLAAPETLQVEHRWYRGDRLVQSVPLTIRAGSGAGFRTYSRQTVPEAQPGEWRVELRSPQGAVLAEERFTVR